jgi:hypothetical protein
VARTEGDRNKDGVYELISRKGRGLGLSGPG